MCHKWYVSRRLLLGSFRPKFQELEASSESSILVSLIMTLLIRVAIYSEFARLLSFSDKNKGFPTKTMSFTGSVGHWITRGVYPD